MGGACTDVYTFSIPWNQAYSPTAVACGLTRSVVMGGDSVQFDGAALLSMVENVGMIDGATLPLRTLQQEVRFTITAPFVLRGLSASVVVFEDPRLERVLIDQRYDPSTDRVVVGLIVSAVAPLETSGLAGAVVVTGPGMPLPAAVPTAGAPACSSTTGSCQQTYRFAVTPGDCTIDGTYTFTFNLACRAGVAAADCPLDGTTTTAVPVTVTMDSEDLCAAQLRQITVAHTLTSHASFDSVTKAFGNEKNATFQSQPIFFQLSLVATGGFNIESARLLEARVGTQPTAWWRCSPETAPPLHRTGRLARRRRSCRRHPAQRRSSSFTLRRLSPSLARCRAGCRSRPT
jgi:hypothetical protein